MGRSAFRGSLVRTPRTGNSKNPRQLPAGGFPRVSSLLGSEVALSADVQEDGALVLVFELSIRLRRVVGDGRSTSVLLVEEERTDFARECQVLDGSPTGDHANNLGNVEVGVKL